MTEPVTFTRCKVCNAVEWPSWPMTHRRNCPNANPATSDWSADEVPTT